MLVLVLSMFSITSLASSKEKAPVVYNDVVTKEYDINGNKVKVKISKANEQKLSPKVLKGLAEEFPNASTINIYNVGDMEVSEKDFTSQDNINPNHHKASQKKEGDFSTLGTQCSYYGLCTEHSHYYVTSKSKTSYGNRGPSRFLISVARGAEKTFGYQKTLSQNSSVTGGVSSMQSEVSATISSGVSKTWSSTYRFSGISPEIILPNNTRDFYWAGIFDSGNWKGREDRYDKYGSYTSYNQSGNFTEYVRYVEWSVDYQVK